MVRADKLRVEILLADDVSLKDQGVDKHLADVARKAASIPEEEFESILEGHHANGKPASSAAIVKHARDKKKKAAGQNPRQAAACLTVMSIPTLARQIAQSVTGSTPTIDSLSLLPSMGLLAVTPVSVQ